MKTYYMENERYKATIADAGAELISFMDKENGREYIWQADPDVWKRHAPVLFPLVGKYKNDTSYYKGTAYHMTQHGFARDMTFEAVRADEEEIVMRLTSSDKTKENYPFAFELNCGYRIAKNRLTVLWEVRNLDADTMYFSIGGHPAFVGKKDSLADAKLEFDIEGDSIYYGLLNDHGLLTDARHTLHLDEEKRVTLSGDFFDRDALIVENRQCGKVSLLQDGARIVTVTFDAPVFGIWSAAKKGVPFVCIEPWYGRTDREDFGGELPQREWANELSPGGLFKASYELAFGNE